MVLNKEEKIILCNALDTERARVVRATNAEKNQAIKEILHEQAQAVVALFTKVSAEVVK